LLTSLLDNYYR